MITDPHKTKYLSIKKKKVPIWTYGKSKNPPIIFIHGLFNSFSEYIGDLPMRYLKENYYIVAFDLPGYGKSTNIKLNNLEFISEVQKQILDNKTTTLFGVSYGGLLSLKYAFKYSSKVNNIIVAGTPVFFGIFNLYKLSAYLPIYKKRKIKEEEIEQFNFLNETNLKKIKLSVLLYYNKRDYIANIFMGKKLNNMLPSSKLFVTSGLNHGWLLHRIDKSGFLKEVESFLKRA